MPASKAPANKGEASEGPSSDLTRVTVNLTRPSMAALSDWLLMTGGKQTDAINRGVQLLSIIEKYRQEGATFVIESGETRTRLEIL